MQDIEEDLRDAMADAQRRIKRLEKKEGVGSVIRRAQLILIRRELRAVQEDLWRHIGKRIRGNGDRIAAAAAKAEETLERLLFQRAGKGDPPESLLQAQLGYAKRTVANYFARGNNGISLSQRVYRSKQLSNGYVDRAINRSLLQGDSWQELAARVVPMIDPDTPGGVSYAAKRLARTELNNAFHTVQQASAEVNPFVLGLKWNLSRSHTRRDRCNELVEEHSDGKPAGVYVPSELPLKPHPQCLCYTTNEMMDEDDFLDLVSSDEFLGDVAEDYGKPNVVELKPKPKPAPKPKKPAVAKKPTVAQLKKRKPVETRRLGGQTGQAELYTYADGSKLVHKDNSKLTYSGEDPAYATDAEFLGAEVLRAFGVRAPELSRDGKNALYMEFIPGKTGGELYGWKEIPSRVLRSPDGRRLGLADYYMLQFDRNEGNWIQDPNGTSLIGIDNGAAWPEGFDSSLRSNSTFAKFMYEADLELSSAEVAEAGRRLQALRPKFEKAGRLDWWEASWAQHESLLGRSTGNGIGIFDDDAASSADGGEGRPGVA